MMNSAISTKRDASTVEESVAGVRLSPRRAEPGLALWQLYALLGMIAAAVAVWVSGRTHPLALILMSGVALASAAVAFALHGALAALLGRSGDVPPLGERQREMLEREKALIMRSIKELEFDHAMGKMGETDFAEIGGRLRARALTLMQDIERGTRAAPVKPAKTRPPSETPATPHRRCAECGTMNDPDAKFCKSCGHAVGPV